jgi:hypothetical protein
MNKRFKTQDTKLALSKDYHTVMEIVQSLWEGQVIQRGGGFCLSMADMIRTLLLQKGIVSHLVECKLTVMSKDPPGLTLIGHDNLIARTGNINEMDTHVVTVTDTDPPMIIDLSIVHLRENTPYIVERVNINYDDTNQLAQLEWGNDTWIYQKKPVSQLPQIYQQSIVDRFLTDRRIFKTLKIMSILITVALTISLLNGIRGAYDFYQVYIDDTNYWGPKHLEELYRKVERLEQQSKN